MKVSLNWLQYYSNVDFKAMPVDTILNKIGAQLGGIEEVTYIGPRYDGVIVAKVMFCEKHQGADKLSLCRIDDGGVVRDVERGDDGYIQVVCGAPNVREGLTVAWLPPGATVPNTVDKDPFVLEVRELRGKVSNGMLASPSELAISDNHDGILEINAEDVGEELSKPGTEFKKLYSLDDVVIDIENKMFTHRPDCFGMLGIARELAGITDQKFVSPDWYQRPESLEENSSLALNASNQIEKLIPRLMLQVIEGVEVKQSPIWLQAALTKIGSRPINNLVDLSNYFMHLTAQPTHAFDYDKIKARSGGDPTISPRMATDGEELTLLNGKTIKLTKYDMVIATDQKAVALAGIMGGQETEVDENTKSIIIECATFDMYTVRRTSMRHGVFSDASTRFTKGQTPLQNDRVLARLTANVIRYAGGQAGKLIDISSADMKLMSAVNVSTEFVNARLGSKMHAEQMAELLRNVEFEINVNGQELEVCPPFWRTDIAIPEDVVEELGRLHGYDNLPMNLPVRSIKPVALNPTLVLKTKIRDVLSRVGANESLNYSFIHGNLLDRTTQDKDQAFQIANALSPDLQYYRVSITPSLLEKTTANLRAGYDHFAMFEIGVAHIKSQQDVDQPEVPKEVNALSLVFAADKKAANNYSGAPYFQAKKYLQYLIDSFGLTDEVKVVKLAGADLYNNPWTIQMMAPYEPEHSAVLRTKDGLIWGVVGEFKSSVRKSLKLPDFIAGFEIDPLLLMMPTTKTAYMALPKFPKVEQDMTLKVPSDLSYDELFEFTWAEIAKHQPGETLPQLTPLDIYQSIEDKDHKNVTFRLVLSAYNRTLKTEEVNSLLDQVANQAKQKFGAERL
jgi:phenylalanyl-tRNA synthetase beta chain